VHSRAFPAEVPPFSTRTRIRPQETSPVSVFTGAGGFIIYCTVDPQLGMHLLPQRENLSSLASRACHLRFVIKPLSSSFTPCAAEDVGPPFPPGRGGNSWTPELRE